MKVVPATDRGVAEALRAPTVAPAPAPEGVAARPAPAIRQNVRVGRPKVPLIDRDEAIAKALELIDRDGLERFSIRRLGSELGVNGASLYHHFQDKEAILQGVRLRVLREGRVVPTSGKATWQEYLVLSAIRYREALLRHPNTAPLMVPGVVIRPTSLGVRDLIVEKMLAAGVPDRYTWAIVASAETLAFGSAAQNPRQLPPRDLVPLGGRKDLPHLARSRRTAPRTAERLFKLELRALFEGWSAVLDGEVGDQS